MLTSGSVMNPAASVTARARHLLGSAPSSAARDAYPIGAGPDRMKNGRPGIRNEKGGCVMPQQAWNDKRERQYQHIKEGQRERGTSEGRAEEIAARTVNKERARSGESDRASKTSTKDISSGRRGGLRSHEGSGGRTKDQLYNEAKQKNVKGRSKMTKQQLARAVGRG
jgi:hypothetical protein